MDEDSVRTCHFSPDSKYLATGDDQGCIKVSLTEGYCNGHEDSVRTCRFPPDSKYLATGDDQGYIKVSLTERYRNGKVELKVFNWSFRSHYDIMRS